MHRTPDPSTQRNEPVSGGTQSRKKSDVLPRRAPLTMRQLYGRGILLVGSAIPLGLKVGGWAWLGLAAAVLVILIMATLHDGGWHRKRHRPMQSAPKRPRTSRALPPDRLGRTPRSRTDPDRRRQHQLRGDRPSRQAEDSSSPD
jgi:hypothetical protein